MKVSPGSVDTTALNAFVEAFGVRSWRERLAELEAAASDGTRAGRAALQRHVIELTIERWRKRGHNRAPSEAELRITDLAADASRLFDELPGEGRDRLRDNLRQAAEASNTLIPTFHLLRTAAMQRARGFAVQFAGLEDDASFDLLLARDGQEAEIACDVVSAEEGRGVHRGAWSRLCDRIDPELQVWLANHPGRYLLKMTLPKGLKDLPEGDALGALHSRITTMLSSQRRADHDEAAVLRLDPLMLAAAQASELGLMPRLRSEFGPEAHLAVTTAERGLFVMAARAGNENEVAVSCSSRLEMFGLSSPDAAPGGELRFRNPAHPSAKAPALAPAVSSSN
jgi:hypothetical protein